MSKLNRLKLDFQLETYPERIEFLDKYLTSEMFQKTPPTEDELATMSDYILWGKDPITGLNAKQAKICELETKRKTWDNHQIESLEGLMESPTFNEASLQPLSSTIPFKAKREVFSRKEALARCPDCMRETFTNLFRIIDETELMINFYELAHSKRKNPPRNTLLIKFNQEEQDTLRARTEKWTQYTYLRNRHKLVELRREQYTLRDSFAPIMPTGEDHFMQEQVAPPEFDVEIEVLPLGTFNGTDVSAALFRPWAQLTPFNATPEQQKLISDLLWKKNDYKPSGTQTYIDFRELEHVYQLLQSLGELQEEVIDNEDNVNLQSLIKTLLFYKDQADLTEVQKDILAMKLRKDKNIDIANNINKKWGKSYTANYISTIFRQRIIPKINEAACYHLKLASNIFFEEEFKTCTACKRVLLLDSDNFTRKSRSKDGYTSRCKRCEKESRNKNKE